MSLLFAASRLPIINSRFRKSTRTNLTNHRRRIMAASNSKKEELDAISKRLAAKFDVPNLTPLQVSDMQVGGGPDPNKELIIIDVRTPDERKVSYIPGSITLDEFRRIYKENQVSKDNTKIVAYCTIGFRSAQTAIELSRKGLDAANLEGSILAWTHAGLPLVTRQGKGEEEVVTKKVHVFMDRYALQAEGYEAVTFKYGMFSFASSMASSAYSKFFNK